jgi:hypothetical protein
MRTGAAEKKKLQPVSDRVARIGVVLRSGNKTARQGAGREQCAAAQGGNQLSSPIWLCR